MSQTSEAAALLALEERLQRLEKLAVEGGQRFAETRAFAEGANENFLRQNTWNAALRRRVVVLEMVCGAFVTLHLMYLALWLVGL